MKFAVVVVVIALALGANSSILPLGPVVVGGPGHVVVGAHAPAAITVAASHPVVAGPGPVQVVSGPVPAVVAAPALVAAHHAVAAAHHAVVAAPHAVVAAPHAVVAAPHPVVAVPGGTFVAKTRGAVHVAPLAGHAQSVASVNLQPAPGTL